MSSAQNSPFKICFRSEAGDLGQQTRKGLVVMEGNFMGTTQGHGVLPFQLTKNVRAQLRFLPRPGSNLQQLNF